MRPHLSVPPMLLLTACGYQQDCRAIQGDIAKFHGIYNDGDFRRLYAESSPEFKKAASFADAAELLGKFRKNLGAYVVGHETGCQVNYNTSGSYVLVRYQTKFANGPGEEQFTFTKSDRGSKLVGYHVNSKLLLK